MRRLLPLLFVAACVPLGNAPTSAVIHRYHAGAFWDCQPELGWTKKEMTAKCGEPIAQVKRAHGGGCYVYDSHAAGMTITTVAAAPYFLVCIDKVRSTYADAPKGSSERRVWAVFGMSQRPTP